MQLVNPADGSIEQFSDTPIDAISSCVARAREAQPAWGELPLLQAETICTSTIILNV